MLTGASGYVLRPGEPRCADFSGGKSIYFRVEIPSRCLMNSTSHFGKIKFWKFVDLVYLVYEID